MSNNNTTTDKKVVPAAGAVLWRRSSDLTTDSAVEIAVIHRPRYDDWSLPKGKVDPGETEPVEKIAYITKIGDNICGVGYYK